MMEIKRTVTYRVSEDEVRKFFDSDWWETAVDVGDEEFDTFECQLVDTDDYCDEVWEYVGDSREQIDKIWQEELEKVKNPMGHRRVEVLKEQLAYFQRELADNQKQIEKLEQAIRDAE